MTRQTRVHVCIADPIAESAVRKLLAASSNVCVSSWGGEHSALNLTTEGLGSNLRNAEILDEIDVLLFGPDDLSRFEEVNPGSIDELQRRVKILLLLKSEELPDSMGLLRHCDGMIVRDLNIGNASTILVLALHGYFVLPHNLMANFRLKSPPTRAAIIEQIGLREGGSASAGRRDVSRDVTVQEYCATRTTMRRAIGSVLRHRKNGARVQLNAVATECLAEERDLNFDKNDGTSSVRWRKALLDDDGRVTAGEYVLLFAAVAIWAAIIFDGGAATKLARAFGWCASVVTSVQCETFARKPQTSASDLASAAKKLQESESGLRKPMQDLKDVE